MSGESPSPLMLTAPLMPPCAHTEWERFTGTKEMRLTSWPASASLIVAISPARPPPTTMNFCFAMPAPLVPAPVCEESQQRVDPHAGHDDAHGGARVQRETLRVAPGGDAP